MSQSLEKGLGLLVALSDHAHDGGRGLALREVAAAGGLDKATAHRLLQSLRKFALVAQDERGRYKLGTGALALAHAALSSQRLVERMRAAMRRLAEETDETVNLCELHDGASVTVHEIPSTQMVRYTTRIGNAVPLHLGASSRVALAFSRPEVVDAVLAAPREAATADSLVDRDALVAALVRARSAGWAASFGERVPGTRAIAVPLLGDDGYAIGSLAILWPSRGESVDAERLRRWPGLLLDAVAQVQGRF